jgi:hypothetical protein
MPAVKAPAGDRGQSPAAIEIRRRANVSTHSLIHKTRWKIPGRRKPGDASTQALECDRFRLNQSET